MKKSCFALFALTIALAIPAQAQNVRVGVIDMRKISENYARYSQAAEQLESRKNELQVIVDQEEQSVMSMIQELEAIRATATENELNTRRTAIEARDRELREFVTGTNREFGQDLQALEQRTRKEVETTVRSISQEMNLSLVLERSLMLYFNETLDITDKVLAELNRLYKPEPLTLKSSSSTRSQPSRTSATQTPASQPSSTTAIPKGNAETSGHWPFR